MKRKIFALMMALVLVFSLFACGTGESGEDLAQEPNSSQEGKSVEDSVLEGQTDEMDEDKKIESGRYELPCGMSIQFSDSVRNDVTGNWRIATTADSFVPADYALEYYNEMFSSDDEIHSIWNATLGTTTRISVALGMLYVDTLEYVDGEEHDANIMFSGTLLDSRIIDIETGELIED